ncbi:MAG: threonylcarbamoyl-AMP synthase [Saprospiraceae bacterium]|nr:threonylcarbamoyl-AMP synthase [Saprospiraceae bacterium]
MNSAAISVLFDYEIAEAASVLQRGGLILFPTDTIWGIGCDACNEAAVEKVYALKQRDRSKPFVLLVDGLEMLRAYVEHVHPRIETLLIHHTRPLTVVYDKGVNLAPNAIGKDGSAAIRIPVDEYCLSLIRKFGKPIVASSANISNEPFPSSFQEVSQKVKQGVDFISKHRQKEISDNEPSVIVKLSDREELIFLRD